MINKLYLLEKDGKLSSYELDSKKIQEYVDSVRDSLTTKYFELERKCNRSEIPGGFYKEYFSRNVIELPIMLLKKSYLGEVTDYEYYQDVMFDNNFAIHFRILARVKQDWEYRYIIENNKEKLPLPIKQLIKKFIDKHQ